MSVSPEQIEALFVAKATSDDNEIENALRPFPSEYHLYLKQLKAAQLGGLKVASWCSLSWKVAYLLSVKLLSGVM